MNNVAKFQNLPSTKPFFGGLFDDFFNRSIADFIGSDNLMSQPAVNVVETDEAFKLEVAAPGFDKTNFEVKVEGKQLLLSGKREQSNEETTDRFTRREFQVASFQRSFHLPESVNPDGVQAVYENGILNVTLPKKEEARPVVKTIEIG